MRHSVPHDSLTQRRQSPEECREGLTSINVWTTKVPPSPENAQGSQTDCGIPLSVHPEIWVVLTRSMSVQEEESFPEELQV